MTARSQVVAAPTRRDSIRLFGLSALMLFVELALIRWLGEMIVYLSFFTNLVLLGSFLGIGIGFLAAGRRSDWIRAAPAGLFALVAFVPLADIRVDRIDSDVLFFGTGTSGLPPWIAVPVAFGLSAVIMATIGQAVAKTFSMFTPLNAYRLDVAGSLVGILAFAGLAGLGAPPVVWGAVGAAGIGLAIGKAGRTWWQVVLLGGVVAMLGAQSFATGDVWSPYYRITTEPFANGSGVLVNGIPHQAIAPLEAQPEFYRAPYRFIDDPAGADVLVIGAGNGVDVAAALQADAARVTAVEIDPTILQLGVDLNPDRPYADPRVTVVVDDARAYLERTDQRFDLIVFGLPDSLTLVAGQSALRLESYLFTIEAIESAKAHLTESGVLVMYNFYREPWLVERLAATLETVFKTRPCVEQDTESRLATLAVGNIPGDAECKRIDVSGGPPPVVDDYPFLYVRDRGIPGLYVVTIVVILAVSVLAVKGVGGRLRPIAGYGDLFFMGAAFLLLETSSIVEFSLLFGTTWQVNALVFGGILVAVLAAVEVARRVELPEPRILYALLLVAFAIDWAVPSRSLLGLPGAPRLVVSVVLAFTPIFLANLIFAQRFAETSSSTTAFGANLLGAMVGGTLEYLSLIVGFRGLLMVAALLYTVAYSLERRLSQRVPAVALTRSVLPP